MTPPRLSRLTRSLPRSRPAREPVGTLHAVDPSRLNWLHVNYNVVEELVRVTRRGKVRPAAMRAYRWVDERTLEVTMRPGNRYADGQLLTVDDVKRSFDELMQWRAPHPPGTHFNLDPATRCEVTGERTVRFVLPAPDGLALGKLRALHVMNARFWRDLGFGYQRTATGEGHW